MHSEVFMWMGVRDNGEEALLTINAETEQGHIRTVPLVYFSLDQARAARKHVEFLTSGTGLNTQLVAFSTRRLVDSYYADPKKNLNWEHLLTREQLDQCFGLNTQAEILEFIIKPNLDEINKRAGLSLDPVALSHALLEIVNAVKRDQECQA